MGALVTVVPLVLQTVDVENQRGLNPFYARGLQELPLLIPFVIGFFICLLSDI